MRVDGQTRRAPPYDLLHRPKSAPRGSWSSLPTIPTPTATASPTRVIHACSIPKTKTAISTTTAAPKSTTTWTRSSIPTTSAPTIPKIPTGTKIQDGCPDLDNDKDTVADIDDQCPNEQGPADGEKPGCPRKPALVVVTDKEIRITQQIHFEFDKDVIRPRASPFSTPSPKCSSKTPTCASKCRGTPTTRGSPPTT